MTSIWKEEEKWAFWYANFLLLLVRRRKYVVFPSILEFEKKIIKKKRKEKNGEAFLACRHRCRCSTWGDAEWRDAVAGEIVPPLFFLFFFLLLLLPPLLLSPTATIHKRSVGQLFFFVLDPFSSVGAFVLCISFLLVVLILDFGVQVHTECHWSDPSSCRLISLLLYYIPRDTARYAKLEPAKQLGYTSFSSDLDLNMNE